MALIFSVDLASKSYKDFGFCLLSVNSNKDIEYHFLEEQYLGLSGQPEPVNCAGAFLDFCFREGVNILMLDGPQGWKDPLNGLQHCRICEKELNTPGKTGEVGEVKPKAYLNFISFSINLYSGLINNTSVRIFQNKNDSIPENGILLIETFPFSAWKSLLIDPLPGKKKCSSTIIEDNYNILINRFDLPRFNVPSHDQLQALVAGMAGVAIACGNNAGFEVAGAPPVLSKDGYLLEGYIVNPK